MEKKTSSFLLISVFTLFYALLPDARVGAQCNNNVVLSITGPQVLDWTAPATGGPFLINITAEGGAGGAYREFNPRRVGGTGAAMSGNFLVQNGETIRAIAGEGGYHSQLEGGGGGGGSGAVNCGTSGDCSLGTLLILAAGGNGGQQEPVAGYGLGGSSATNGSGDGGETVVDTDSGGGGGGLNSDGETAPSGGDGGQQVSLTGLVQGGAGSFNMQAGSGNNKGGSGMGGGGGGGDGAEIDNAAGGGAGHTGGSGGNVIAASSFNSGASQINEDGITGGGEYGDKSTPSDPGSVIIICLSALPVELINFKAFLQHNDIHLHWSTATELNNEGFEVQHSLDGRHWTEIGFVTGSGTTTVQQDYRFEHKAPPSGVNYYRLKQLDYDGAFEYSPVVVVDHRNTTHAVDIFPNPSNNGYLSVRILSKESGQANLEIFDWAGYRVYRDQLSLFEGTTVWPLSMATFPKGTYTARLMLDNGEVLVRKVVLQ